MNDRQNDTENEFGHHIRQGINSARDGLRTFVLGVAKVASEVSGFVYYWQWNRKARFKRAARAISFAVVVFSSAILLVEAGGEYYGAEGLVFRLKSLPVSETTRLAIFLGSALFLVVHYRSEIRKPEHEYNFVTRLFSAMSRQRNQSDPMAALPIFHALFTKAGVKHVSVYRPTEDGKMLRIVATFPQESDPSYSQELAVGRGVAGRVFKDKIPRYVARLFFPNGMQRTGYCIYLPHAQKFVLEEHTGQSGRLALRLIEQKVEAHIFETDNRRSLLYSSFLSVPIIQPQTGECLGVLNFDFDKPGCLDSVDVTMASVFGRWFGLEIS